MAAVAPIPANGAPISPASVIPTLLHLDVPRERARLADLLRESQPVFEDSKRDTAALERVDLQCPEHSDDLRLMVHSVDESRCDYDSESKGRNNDIFALARDLYRDTALLTPKLVRKIDEHDTFKREQQVVLRVKYLVTLYDRYAREQARDPHAAAVYQHLDLPMVPVFRDMEAVGVGCDDEAARWMAMKEDEDQTRDMEALATVVPRPHAVLNDNKLRTLVYSGWRFQPKHFSKNKKPSVKDKALLALGDPRLTAIVRVRKRDRLLTALNQLAEPRLHSTFDLASAVTGRVYVRQPNLQGVPRTIRELIIPAEGCVFIILDYSQMELHVLAELSRDPRLVGAILAGRDLHTETAAVVYGVRRDDVTKDQRDVGKEVNFGVIYGETFRGLSEALGVSFSDAESYLQRHKRAFPGVEAWRKRTITQAIAAGGLVRSRVGRRRYLPAVCSQRGRAKASRQLINFMVQSLAADIYKSRLRQIAEAVRGVAWPVLSVHDEIVLECARASADGVLREVVEIAQRPVRGFCVPLKVNAVIGKTWADKP